MPAIASVINTASKTLILIIIIVQEIQLLSVFVDGYIL